MKDCSSTHPFKIRYSGLVFLMFLLLCFLIGCNNRSGARPDLNTDVVKGEALFLSSNCNSCHSISGQVLYGPPLNAILNTSLQVLRNDTQLSITVDRDFILRSIRDPDYEKSTVFKSRKMPKPTLTNQEMEWITDYLISINTKK